MMDLIDSRMTGVVMTVIMSIAYGLGIAFAPRLLFLEALNGMLAVLSVTVMIVYMLDVLRQFRNGNDRGAWIRLGISLSWTVGWTQAIGRVYFIEFAPSVSGRTFDALLGLPAFLLILAASAHVIAIGMVGRLVPRRNTCMVAWSLIGGLAGVLLMRAMHSHL